MNNFRKDTEAVIFDTPTNDQNATELTDYIRSELNLLINAIDATI